MSDDTTFRPSRRHFLKGMGATLALPFLPSLLSPLEARAQSGAAVPRCYLHLATHHGGVWASRMYPQLPSSGVQTQSYAGRQIRNFAVDVRHQDGTGSLSPVLSGPSTLFTPELAAKMNVLQGLDVPFYLAHHTGGHLGNFARNDGNGTAGQQAQTQARRRTIDQIMAWSPSFYGDLAGVRERVMVMGSGMSFNWTNPTAQTGTLQEIAQSASSPAALFDKLFPQPVGGGGGAQRPLVVDAVYENYRRLRDGGRLSAADRGRLEDHMQRVYELQRRLTVTTGTACDTTGRRPSGTYAALAMGTVNNTQPHALNPEAHASWFRTLTDVMVLAMSCGVSRIGVMRVDPRFSNFAGDWHQEVAHRADATDGVRQGVLAESKRRFFSGVMLELASKMDAVQMGDGQTLLDHSLVVWTQECGNTTHNSDSMPVVTFGSAGGSLRTGQVCDYRNLSATINPNAAEKRYPGLLWHQWLGTVLQAMGLPKSEWERPSVNLGYPDYKFARLDWSNLTTAQAYPETVWQVAGEVLPFLRPA